MTPTTIQKAFLFLALAMLLLSCKKPAVTQKEECTSEIEYVKVGFIMGDVMFASNICCGDFYEVAEKMAETDVQEGFSPLYKKTIITDCLILKRISESLLKISKDTTGFSSIDVRMKCIIKYKSKKSDTICISGNNIATLNGEFVMNTDSLIYTIRKAVHYYRYFPAEAYPYFHEIKKFEYGGK